MESKARLMAKQTKFLDYSLCLCEASFFCKGKEGATVLQTFSAILSTFLAISSQKSYSKTLSNPLKVSENLCPLPLNLSTTLVLAIRSDNFL